MTKAIKIIFTLSILFNLVLAGVVGGSIYKMSEYHKPSVELGEETHDLIRKNMKISREEMRSSFQEMRQQREALKDIITAPEFNRESYDKAVDKIIKAKNDMAYKKAKAMGRTLSELSQEDRQKMSKRFLRGFSSDHRKSPRGDDRRRSDKRPSNRR